MDLKGDDKKKYVLVIDQNNNNFANLPLINDGPYLIRPLEYKDKVFELYNENIILNKIKKMESKHLFFNLFQKTIVTE